MATYVTLTDTKATMTTLVNYANNEPVLTHHEVDNLAGFCHDTKRDLRSIVELVCTVADLRKPLTDGDIRRREVASRMSIIIQPARVIPCTPQR